MDSNNPMGVAPVLQLHPTRRCNLACAHCYSSSGPTLREAMRLGRALGLAVHVDTLTLEQLLGYRGHLVPPRPPQRLVDAAPVLVVQADASVLPLTHEIDASLWLGSLHDAPLPALARDWLGGGRAGCLVDACARTWAELTGAGAQAAVYWYDEVAARARAGAPG